MKQTITKEQWKELDREEVTYFINGCSYPSDMNGFTNMPTIGQMIEFLGDDLDGIDVIREDKLVRYRFLLKDTSFTAEEPIDSGWAAVKYKLKN